MIHLKPMLRHLTRKKLFALINICGLAVGLAGVLLLMLYVQDEWAIDRQHPTARDKYRLEANFPEVIATTRFTTRRPRVAAAGSDTSFHEDVFAFADPNIAEFFSFEWLQGDPARALERPDSVVLTPALVSKYFGDSDPMGRTLVIDGTLALNVTGVIADPALRTHIDVDALAPMAAFRGLAAGEAYLQDWFGLGIASYVQLRPGTDMEALWPSIAALLDETIPPVPRQLFAPRYRPLPDVHLSTRENPTAQRTRFDDAVVLFSISLAILLVACVNFVNLATARASERYKEIAIRKVVGSGQWQIFYPAFYLSRFRPRPVLRQKQHEGTGLLALRNLLVVFQFAVAIVAIVAGIVMMRQLDFAKTRDPGFDMRDVYVVENSPGDHWDSLREAVRSQTGIEHITAAISRPFRAIATSTLVRYEGGDPAGVNLSPFGADFGYFELFDVPLLAGRYFSPQFGIERRGVPSDDNPHPEMGVILNEAMLDRLGWTPEEAIGRRFEVSVTPDFAQSLMGTVVGVVANMYVDPVQREVVPQFYYAPASAAGFDFMFFKLLPGNHDEQKQQIARIWRELYPDTPLNACMLEEKFREVYRREERQLALLGAFAFLAVFISCIGLIGLATYMAEQRVKEVGVRKVAGANVWQIVLLFSADFSWLVLVANAIAWPIAWIAYRIDLTPMIFIGGGLIAMCIAWVAVGGTAARAALAKPVVALRYE